jgi:plasmid maintenance system antidote protein VapI
MTTDDDSAPIPSHPGYLMEYAFMEGRGLSIEDVATGSGLSHETVQGIIDGIVDITEPVAVKLARVLGGSAETLYRAQVEFDRFKSDGTIIPFDELPHLVLPAGPSRPSA